MRKMFDSFSLTLLSAIVGLLTYQIFIKAVLNDGLSQIIMTWMERIL